VTKITTLGNANGDHWHCMDISMREMGNAYSGPAPSAPVSSVVKSSYTCNGPYTTQEVTTHGCNADCSTCTGSTTTNDFPAWGDNNEYPGRLGYDQRTSSVQPTYIYNNGGCSEYYTHTEADGTTVSK